MRVMFSPGRLAGLLLLALPLAALQAPSPPSVKTSLCEIFAHPENFEGKLVQFRSLVDSGVDDLPSGMEDAACGAEVKFFTPDDPQFARLLKSPKFRKLVKTVKNHPLVEATVAGWFRRIGPPAKPQFGLALDSVQDVKVKNPRAQNR